MAGERKRTVFVVNIEEGSDSQGLFHSMYGPLMKMFENTSLSVSIVDSEQTFKAKCVESNPNETVFLFTNELIAKKKNMQETLKQFVNGGGLAIFGCLFSSFTTPPVMDAMFQNFGLQWKNSQYNRTTFGITDVGRFLLTDIEEKFSVKALQLSNVLPEQKIYTPVENATTQSMVFAPKPADASLAMSAFGKIGMGAVAYIGDVNAEKGSNRLTIALCLATW